MNENERYDTQYQKLLSEYTDLEQRYRRMLLHVKEMRDLQKKYFTLRDKETLKKAKRKEALVDNAVKQRLKEFQIND